MTHDEAALAAEAARIRRVFIDDAPHRAGVWRVTKPDVTWAEESAEEFEREFPELAKLVKAHGEREVPC
jgi:hypothetical protein